MRDGWTRDSVKTNGATPNIKTAHDSAYTSELLFGEFDPIPHPTASHQTHEPKQNDLQERQWCGTELLTNTTCTSSWHVRQTDVIRRLPPNQRNDVSLLKTREMDCHGTDQGLVPRATPPRAMKTTTMAEADETLRFWWIAVSWLQDTHDSTETKHSKGRQIRRLRATKRPILRLLKQRRSRGAQLRFWVGSRTSR